MHLEYDFVSDSIFKWKALSSQRARFAAYQFESGSRLFFHEQITPSITEKISSIGIDDLINNQHIVRRHIPPAESAKIWRGCSYTFNHQSNFSTLDRKVTIKDAITIEENGRTVSRAYSARENNEAAELIVETEEEYRRRGYAKLVTSIWAKSILESGRIAFYSHIKENTPSRHLAKSLNLIKFSEIAAYD